MYRFLPRESQSGTGSRSDSEWDVAVGDAIGIDRDGANPRWIVAQRIADRTRYHLGESARSCLVVAVPVPGETNLDTRLSGQTENMSSALQRQIPIGVGLVVALESSWGTHRLSSLSAASAPWRAAPQFVQNAAPGAATVEHTPHVTVSSVPQRAQNFASSAL